MMTFLLLVLGWTLNRPSVAADLSHRTCLEDVMQICSDHVRGSCSLPLNDGIVLGFTLDHAVGATVKFPGKSYQAESVDFLSGQAMSKAQEELRKFDGDLRLVESGVWQNESCRFGVTDQGRPYVAVEGNQLRQNYGGREVLEHEMEHFAVWRELRERLIENDRKGGKRISARLEQQAGVLAQDVGVSLDGVVYNESRAVAREMEVRLEKYKNLTAHLDTDLERFAAVVGSIPGLDPRVGFQMIVGQEVQRAFYPLSVGIQRAFGELSSIRKEMVALTLESDSPIRKFLWQGIVKRLGVGRIDKAKALLAQRKKKRIDVAVRLMTEYVQGLESVRKKLIEVMHRRAADPSLGTSYLKFVEQLSAPLGPMHPLASDALFLAAEEDWNPLGHPWLRLFKAVQKGEPIGDRFFDAF